jgi:RNA polymerase sigma factor (sigma-70 family)
VEEDCQEAFADLIRRHAGSVHRAARRWLGGDGRAAGEVARAVFVTLAIKAGGLARHEVVAGWLHTSVRYAALRRRRSEARRRNLESEIWAAEETAHAAPPAIAWERLRPLLDEILLSLTADDREAIRLRFFAEWTYPELAARLGLTENTARMRVSRALDRLQALLARRGIISITSAGALAGTV